MQQTRASAAIQQVPERAVSKLKFFRQFSAAGNFMHTFPGQDRTSCTLLKAVFRNLCILALHPVRTVRPPTVCPVLLGVEAQHARRQGWRRTIQPSTFEARSRRKGDHSSFRLNDYSWTVERERRAPPRPPLAWLAPPPFAGLGAPTPLAGLGATSRRAWSPSICPPAGGAACPRLL